MTAQIQSLIDKTDNFELIGAEIAAILAVETVSQQVLATAAGKDPDLWALAVYRERSNPWERYLNSDDTTPIVNVWFDSATYDAAASNTIKRQKADATYNIDCYGRGISQADGAGHVAGDKKAATEAHRCLRLVRNILMASQYTYLGMQGTVWRRWPQSITVFQPQEIERSAQQIVAARLALEVQFNELSPQYEYETLEQLNVSITKETADGLVYITAQYDYETEE